MRTYTADEVDAMIGRALARERERVAQQQEPVALPANIYEHHKFTQVGREWYERFAAFHDDCQIGAVLTREEQTVRQQGYENGWNDAQRYLRELHQAAPSQQQEPVAFSCLRCVTPKKCAIYGCSPNTWPSETPPAQRKPWVGLTDEERHACTQSPFSADNYRAIEAKLKEKNT